MPKNKEFILLFRSIHEVLRAEKILRKQNVRHELVPVPRNLSTDCGMCIKLESDAGDIQRCLADIEIDRSFTFDGENYEQVEF